MYGLTRSVLFGLDPERAHELALWGLERVQRSAWLRARVANRRPDPDPRLGTSAFGVRFPEPLGMAAGFDKGARAYNALFALGFGHVEIGTVTPEPQEGNPRPRVERYPEQRAVVNRLGFPNPGTEAVAQQLAERAPEGILGVNVGPNKGTREPRLIEDYWRSATALAGPAAYVAVNVSSPNTPGLRGLQEPESVADLVIRVKEALDQGDTSRPVLVKLHPDAEDERLLAVARAAVDAGVDGLIAVNTTTERPTGLDQAGEGGLSGRPLKTRATQVVARLYRTVGEDVPIVGVGGIETGEDAIERVRAGASLLQAYTGFVFRGPRFPVKVHQEMLDVMDDLGVDRLEELVGRDAAELATG